jgi:amidase
MKRREFLAQVGGAAGALTAIGLAGCASPPASHRARKPFSFEFEEASVTELRRGLESGRFTSRSLTAAYLHRIAQVDKAGPHLNAIIEINPDALAIAGSLDLERREKSARGPLHGIPVLIKDNIDTADHMMTTAGSLALLGSRAPRDSFVAERLRAAGAVILGKTNLSEWANFRGSRSISGWSGRGGQTRNPFCTACSPSGSSSGSAAAVSASLCAVAVGTETNGSIVSPSSYCGIVGLKPTVGLVSRAGIIPISASQDTAGPMARTVADAATLLSVLAGADPRDEATAGASTHAHADYTQFLDANALRGARVGMVKSQFKMHRRVDPIWEAALATLRQAGAEVVESMTLPSRQDLNSADYQVMLYEFKQGLNAYFASLGAEAPVRSMEALIAFNEKHRDVELRFFGQETLIEAQTKGPLTDSGYVDAKARCRKWSDNLGGVIREHRLDAIVAPTSGPAHTLDLVNGDRGLGGSSTYAAVSGFPNITVPCGDIFGLPVGLSFFGPAWSEPRLIALAYAFEQASRARRVPEFRSSIEYLV